MATLRTSRPLLRLHLPNREQEVHVDERLRVLDQIERGEISAQEGIQRLEALGQPDAATQAVDPASPGSSEGPEGLGQRAGLATEAAAPVRKTQPVVVRVVSQVVFWSGIAWLLIGALLVAAVYIWSIPALWLAWGGVLMGLGLLVMLLGWWLQRARWLSLRVREAGGRHFAFALPLPLGLTAWALRVARPFVPQLRETGMDEVILALRDQVSDGQPLVVDVQEGDQGEQVQVYLG